MKRKEIIQALIATKQSEIPFNVIKRDIELPLDSEQIITIPWSNHKDAHHQNRSIKFALS